MEIIEKVIIIYSKFTKLVKTPNSSKYASEMTHTYVILIKTGYFLRNKHP